MSTVDELASITGLEQEQASLLLEAAGGDLATAVQLHFDNEDRLDRPGNSAADEAAARAAQMEEDAANYGEFDYDDDDGFPEPVPDGRAARGAHSPVPDGAPVPVHQPRPGSRLARLYAFLGWMAAIPGFSFLYRALPGGGRALYRTGTLRSMHAPRGTPRHISAHLGARARP